VKGYEHGEFGWEVRGSISNALRVTPPTVFYGETLLAKGSPIPAKSVDLESKNELMAVDVTCDSYFGLATAVVVENDPCQWVIEIAPSDELPIGPFAYTVAVNAIDKNRKALPAMYLHVRGTIFPDIQAFPHELLLGQQHADEPVTAEIVLSSARGDQFEITSVDHGKDVFGLAPPRRPAAKSHRIPVTVVPTGNAACESHVVFTVKKSQKVPQRVKVPVRYYVLDEAKTVCLPIISLSAR
jgi:hypothetical protein